MRTIAGVVFLGCGVLMAQETGPNGTINAVTGDPEVRIGPNGEIRTGRGMAEILLTPGNFLRLGSRAEVMITSSRSGAEVKKGVALLESLSSAAPITIDEGPVATILPGPGLIEFDRDHGAIIVFSGNADLRKGATRLIVPQGFEANTSRLKLQRIMPRAGDTLYAWASYRSEQLSSESAAVQASDVPRAELGRPSWLKLSWADSYTFISPSGYVNSPFGWPFYAPGHSHNYIPVPRSGDSFHYGPPVVPLSPGLPVPQREIPGPPTVPLTAPGVPTFPNSR